MTEEEMRLAMSNAKDVKCEECGCKYFTSVYAIKRISKLYTGEDKDRELTMHTFACAKCGHVNEEHAVKDSNGIQPVTKESGLII